MSNQQFWDDYDKVLREMKMERNRKNWLWLLYDGNVPPNLDNDDELALPPDLRIDHWI